LDKGPVIYEAYYPDTPQESSQEKRYFDRNTVLETSFQMPSKRFAYSIETTNRPIWNNESSIESNEEKKIPLRKQWKIIKTQRDYNFTNEFVPFHGYSAAIFDKDENTQNVNVEEISNFVRKVISRNLESWTALKKYFERINNQAQPLFQLKTYFKNHKNEEDYSFQINQRIFNPSRRLSSEISQKLKTRNVRQLQPSYLEEIDGSKNTMKDKIIVNSMQATDTPSINIFSDSTQDIFQPRPQLIKYTFFRKLIPRFNEGIEKMTDKSILHNYGDNLIREEIVDGSHDKQIKEDIKITSIEVSKLPQHKTRHHHDEWPKRHYPIHRHHSQSTIYPI